MSFTNASNIFPEVKKFCEMVQKIKPYLSKFPNRWPKFQEIFDSTVNQVVLEFQRIEEDIANKSKLNRIKKLFCDKYRRYFLHGELVKWSFEKPFGYPGDFKIIDKIYQNNPSTTGLDRLYDNHFLKLTASCATRERKEDFKQELFKFIKNQEDNETRIMNLGCGSAREIKELIEENPLKLFLKVTFDCYDFDNRAINYAKRLLKNISNINFFEKHALRLAFSKDIEKEICWKYDLIYSTGLFDYLDERLATKLVSNLRKILKDGGMMKISNYRERSNNDSAYLMEWVCEWYLIYRTEDEFRRIFLNAGFSQNELQIIPQRSKVMQYCFATRRR
jgi:chemotaxis methyl-accepting protein methylase